MKFNESGYRATYIRPCSSGGGSPIYSQLINCHIRQSPSPFLASSKITSFAALPQTTHTRVLINNFFFKQRSYRRNLIKLPSCTGVDANSGNCYALACPGLFVFWFYGSDFIFEVLPAFEFGLRFSMNHVCFLGV